MPTMTKKKPASKKKPARVRVREERCEACMIVYPIEKVHTRDGVTMCHWCWTGMLPPQLQEGAEPEPTRRKEWYAVAVAPGRGPDKVVIDEETGLPKIQNRTMAEVVKARLMKKARIEDAYPSRFGRVLVPTTKQVVLRKGRRVVQNKRAMYNYVAVQCVMDEDMIHMIQEVPGVIGILPLKPQLKGYRYPRKEPRQARKVVKWELEAAEDWRPVPMAPEEVETLLAAERDRKKARPVSLPFKVGDKVKIKDGVWKRSVGTVKAVLGPAAEPMVKVTVQVIGRNVDVDVLWRDLERSK